MCPECNGIGRVVRLDHAAVLRPHAVAQRGRDPAPRLRRRQLVLAHLRPVGPVRQRQAAGRLHRRRVAAAALRRRREDRDRRARPQDDERRLRGRRDQVHPALHRRRRERRERAQEGDRRPVHDLAALPGVRRHAAERGRAHRRRSTGARCPRCCGARPGSTCTRCCPPCAPTRSRPLVDEAVARVGALVDMGLGYLTLDRETSTLSGGESQRIKMVRHLGSSLVDVMYVFDEPTIGLHPRDVGRMNALLHRLRDKGNTVLVVEHDTDVITAADHVVELGPRAGTDGGRVVYEGDVAGLARAGTLTGEFLHRPVASRTRPRTPTGRCTLKARRRTTCATSTSTSRSACSSRSPGWPARASRTLVREVLLPQHPARSSSTSPPWPPPSGPPRPPGPGSWTRSASSTPRRNGVKPVAVQLQLRGACPTCNGLGAVYSDLAFLDGVRSTCADCDGPPLHRRGAGAHRRRPVDLRRARPDRRRRPSEFFASPTQRDIRRRLQAVVDVGLGLPHARPAAVHAVRRRVPAAQAGRPAARAGQPLRPRRADHRPAHVRLRAPAGAARPARRRRQLGDRRRAQPRRRRACRLGDRPGPGRRRRGRRGGVHRDARRRCAPRPGRSPARTWPGT